MDTRVEDVAAAANLRKRVRASPVAIVSSKTTARIPAFATSAANANPPAPLPMTTTSGVLGETARGGGVQSRPRATGDPATVADGKLPVAAGRGSPPPEETRATGQSLSRRRARVRCREETPAGLVSVLGTRSSRARPRRPRAGDWFAEHEYSLRDVRDAPHARGGVRRRADEPRGDEDTRVAAPHVLGVTNTPYGTAMAPRKRSERARFPTAKTSEPSSNPHAAGSSPNQRVHPR